MIDPKAFINPYSEDPDNFVEISGVFFCDKCMTTSSSAKLDLDSNSITWKCSCGENNSTL